MSSEQQIAKLAGAIVEHQRHLGAMSNEDCQWAIQNTATAISLFNEAVRNRATMSTSILQFVTKFDVSGRQLFSAKKKFVVDTDDDAEVKISYLGDNFKRIFGNLVEKDVEATNLNVHKLNQASLDPDIMAELGAERRVIKLAHFHEALRQQGNGQSGPLLTNGNWNIAYIYGNDGNVWAVDDYWLGRGWSVGARSVGSPGWWRAGNRVMSR